MLTTRQLRNIQKTNGTESLVNAMVADLTGTAVEDAPKSSTAKGRKAEEAAVKAASKAKTKSTKKPVIITTDADIDDLSQEPGTTLTDTAVEVPQPVKLSKKEMMVLEAVFEGIHAETRSEFCYADSFTVSGLNEKQIGGYLSQLSQKGLINICDDEFKQITLTELALVTVNLDFLASFKHDFEADPIPSRVKASTGKDKPEPKDTKTVLTGKGPRRIGQIIRRVFRSRHIKVAVTFDTTTHEYTVKVVEGNSLKFASIFESQFDIKGSRAQDYSYFTFTA